jgi:hypothetical protein
MDYFGVAVKGMLTTYTCEKCPIATVSKMLGHTNI